MIFYKVVTKGIICPIKKKIPPKFSILMNQLLPELYMDNEGQGTPLFFIKLIYAYSIPFFLHF